MPTPSEVDAPGLWLARITAIDRLPSGPPGATRGRDAGAPPNHPVAANRESTQRPREPPSS